MHADMGLCCPHMPELGFSLVWHICVSRTKHSFKEILLCNEAVWHCVVLHPCVVNYNLTLCMLGKKKKIYIKYFLIEVQFCVPLLKLPQQDTSNE